MAAGWAGYLILFITSNTQVLKNIVAVFAFKFVNRHGDSPSLISVNNYTCNLSIDLDTLVTSSPIFPTPTVSALRYQAHKAPYFNHSNYHLQVFCNWDPIFPMAILSQHIIITRYIADVPRWLCRPFAEELEEGVPV